VFDRVGPYYVVVKQPETEEELSQTLDALVCCPVGSVGSRQRHNIKPVIDSFPRLMAGNVFYLGFNSPKSYGGKSYFIDDDGGNWMVDSPKFTPRLVRWIEERGGLRYIFLTHKDDVADASAYGAKCGAQRIIHEKDSQAQKDAEVIKAIAALDSRVAQHRLRQVTSCSLAPVACVLGAARGLGATEARLVCYGTSADAGGDPQSATGYAGIIIT